MDPIMGMIILWPGTFIPQGWALCDGSNMSISQNSALFSLLGTTYGGDGTSTFALPDLRNRVAAGVDPRKANNPYNMYALAGVGGAESYTLTAQQVPAHTHPATTTVDTSQLGISVKGTPYNNGTPTTNAPAVNTCLTNGNTSAGDDTNIYNISPSTGNMASPSASLSGNISVNVQVGNSVAASQAVQIAQPYLRLNYIIATQGIYPTRD